MPSVFKAWLDRIMIEGRTLGFTPRARESTVIPELTMAPAVPRNWKPALAVAG